MSVPTSSSLCEVQAILNKSLEFMELSLLALKFSFFPLIVGIYMLSKDNFNIKLYSSLRFIDNLWDSNVTFYFRG